MKALVKTIIAPVLTTEELENIEKVTVTLKAILSAADSREDVILIDRDGEDIYDTHIVANVIDALDALTSVAIE